MCVAPFHQSQGARPLIPPFLTITKLNPINAVQIMSAEITINKDYILVEPKEGINYRKIRACCKVVLCALSRKMELGIP